LCEISGGFLIFPPLREVKRRLARGPASLLKVRSKK
jgi:drug/metabolite transporter superfamily protein YnfA